MYINLKLIVMNKLFRIVMKYGQAIVVAKTKNQVLEIIKTDDHFDLDFCDINSKRWSDKKILSSIEEIKGYSVLGPSKVISYYVE